MVNTEFRLGERIKARRESLGWSQARLAKATNIDPSLISHYEKGTRRLHETAIDKITKALGWSPEKLYSSDSNVEDPALDAKPVPLLEYGQAGQWVSSDTKRPKDAESTVTVSLETPPSTFALRVRGDSMQPKFLPGDIVIIAPTVTPKPGSFVVATDASGAATFRRYRELGLDEDGVHVFELVAMNADYASMRSDRQPIVIVGTMIEHRRQYPAA